VSGGFLRRSMILGALSAVACKSQVRNYNICVLLDVSKSYVREARSSLPSIGVIINSMQSNDRLTVGTIQTCSFSNDGVIVDRTFPPSPEQVFRQRVQVYRRVQDYFRPTDIGTSHTDIRGGVLFASQVLTGTEALKRILIVASDLVETPSPGCSAPSSIRLDTIDVFFAGVARTAADQRNPDAYAARIAQWEAWARDSGAASVQTSPRVNDAANVILGWRRAGSS
jgi:hypothetical protein